MQDLAESLKKTLSDTQSKATGQSKQIKSLTAKVKNCEVRLADANATILILESDLQKLKF